MYYKFYDSEGLRVTLECNASIFHLSHPHRLLPTKAPSPRVRRSQTHPVSRPLAHFLDFNSLSLSSERLRSSISCQWCLCTSSQITESIASIERYGVVGDIRIDGDDKAMMEDFQLKCSLSNSKALLRSSGSRFVTVHSPLHSPS